MTGIDRQASVHGISLHRREWLPEGKPRAAVMIVHGQGDDIDRYECSIVRLFHSRGIACTGIDFPGHGRSPGQRGDIPDQAFVDATLREAFAAATELAAGAPVGVFAHSMGGLLAIDWLAAADSPRPDFLWLSSPLVDPRNRQPKWRVAMCHVLAKLAPWWIMSSGVCKSDCRHDAPDIAVSPATAMLHSRIRLGWAVELLGIADRLPMSVQALPPRLPVLFTQGLADPVCPPDRARELFRSLPCIDKRMIELADGLHETFDDTCREELLTAAGTWLGETLGV